MRCSQFFLLLALVSIAPRLPESMAAVLGSMYFVLMAVAAWIESRKK